MNDPLDMQSQATGHRLAEALQEIRERAMETIEALENGSSFQADDAASEEPGGTTQEIEDLLDDDLGLREKIAKCSDLRASLVRKWAAAHRMPSPAEVNALIALDQAIDRSLLESIARARTRARRRRELFLAMLGHDLRTPLGAVVLASEYLVARGRLNERDRRLATRIRNSARRMTDLVNDLLAFSRCRLGDGIPLVRGPASLEAIGREIVEEAKAAHPECELQFAARGELKGEWDAGRLGEALANLVENAVVHGASAPVTVDLIGGDDEVVASIHNDGIAIPDGDLGRIFDPFVYCANTEGIRRPRQGLGLGLYIAREIARAHGGSITVSSSAQAGTTFDVHLPRAG
jgi:signal transduction histidine kinase